MVWMCLGIEVCGRCCKVVLLFSQETSAQPGLHGLHRCMPAGAQIPLEDVPSVQKEIVVRCRQAGKPVIVASHLLQSMIEYPTPTRAEVCTA